jgi:hypothetical protein
MTCGMIGCLDLRRLRARHGQGCLPLPGIGALALSSMRMAASDGRMFSLPRDRVISVKR